MRALMFDPSGNFKEGKGTSGWALFVDGKLEEFGEIKASNFPSLEKYWEEHWIVVDNLSPQVVVCESYKLAGGSRGSAQFGSDLETPQLIGFLRMACHYRSIKFFLQHPQDKARVTDPILTRMGVFEQRGNKHYCMGLPTNLHMRDAIRHGIFFHMYNKGKVVDVQV